MKYRKYAPILHTAFREKYREGLVEAYAQYCADMGYSGISLEGKSHQPLDEVDGWIADYLKNTEKMIRAAAANGLEVWLFDEWGYPSGTAAGKTIVQNPDYRSKTLRISLDVILHEGETVELKLTDRFVTASAWSVGRVGTAGDIAGDSEVIEPEGGVLRYTARGGTKRIAAVSWDYTSGGTHGVFRDAGQPEYGTIDLLSYEAVQSFIQNMHERYYAAFGELFGKGLAGFFYDEPFIPYPFPYTDGIFETFSSQKGYNIIPFLPQMLIPGWYTAENAGHILDYRDVITRRMADAFVRQLRQWCHAHGVLQSGHQDLDHSIRGLNTISGDFFRNSEQSDSPGIDYIWNQLNRSSFCDYPRFAGSVKHLEGKAHASSESFAATGYAMPTDRMRWAMEHQIVRGIDRFFLMISEPETKLEKTRLSMEDPQNILFGRMLNERIAAVNRLACSGRAAAELAIYVPMDEVYLQALKAGHPWMTSTMPHIWEQIDKIAEAVCYLPQDYEYIWDGAIEGLAIEGGAFLSPTGQSIGTVIIPGGVPVPEKTRKKLHSFSRCGGRVIVVGRSVEGFWGNHILLVESAAELQNVIPSELFRRGSGGVSLAKRMTERGAAYFLLNESNEYQSVQCGKRLFEYSFARDRFDIYIKEGCLRFAPGELRIFTAVSAGTEKSSEAIVDGEYITIDHWKLSMPDGGTIDVGECLPDWRSFISPVYSGCVKFEADFETPRSGRVRIEFGRIRYAAVIALEGNEYKLPFAPYRLDAELTAGTHHIVMTIYNTEANELLGTRSRELESLEQRKLRGGDYEHDRFFLKSGFEEAVKVYLYDE